MSRHLRAVAVLVVLSFGTGCAGTPVATGMDEPRHEVTFASAAPSQDTATYPPYQKATVAPFDPENMRTLPPDAVVGTLYAVDVWAHCPIDHIRFGGANWRSELPVPTEGMLSVVSGTMELLDPDTVRFVIDLQYFAEPVVEVIIYHRTPEEPSPCA